VNGINSLNSDNYSLDKKYSIISNLNEFYCPIAISIWSLHNNTEAFKGIIKEIYNIAYKNSETFDSYSREKINHYRFVEVINYCIFICGIASPPHFSRMKLKFSKIN